MPLEVKVLVEDGRSPARSPAGRLSPFLAFPPGWGLAPEEGEQEGDRLLSGLPAVSCKERVAQCCSGRWVAWYYVACILATLSLIVITAVVGWEDEGGKTSLAVFVAEVVLTACMVLEAVVRTWLLGCRRSLQSAWHVIDCIACVLVLCALLVYFEFFHQDSWEQILLAVRFCALGIRALVLLWRHRTHTKTTGRSAEIFLPSLGPTATPRPSSKPSPVTSAAPPPRDPSPVGSLLEGAQPFGSSLGKLATFGPPRSPH
eukprot:Hpha_TRINITY_DN16367_c1_g5::TRINITY_DN16367_c1_g5_i3::g.62899::m.62899